MVIEQRSGDEPAVRNIMEQYANAWNERDPKALASLFVEGADFVSSLGLRVNGRRALEEFYTNTLIKGEFKGTTLESKVDSVRFAGSDVAIGIGQFRILGEGQQLARAGYNQFVAVREGGRWQLQSFQATAAKGATGARAAA